MNIYSKRSRWKFILVTLAVAIGIGSLWYTNRLVKELAKEEHKKVELWAKATSLIVSSDVTGEPLAFLLNVIENNETVPVILIDKDSNITHRNIDTAKARDPVFLYNQLEKMKSENPPIEIPITDNEKQYLYYSRSTILTKLIYYPLIQLGVIILFILVAYLAFSSSRRAEQNQVWVGLSKETAHQLGTPISSLMAWVEILKMKETSETYVNELDKDINRLNKVAERFSKIGSKPVLVRNDLMVSIHNTINYLRSRSSNKIGFTVESNEEVIELPLNPPLFEWVIENICKNAMDAIEGKGSISVIVSNNERFVFVDISDTGKGIAKSNYKTIFKPGFTTKARGWGLGLSLTKRIVEEYHNGKIFVSESELGKGTTFRIILKKDKIRKEEK